MVKIGKAKIKKEKPIMPFGKYEGEYLEDIPTDYLEWLHNQSDFKYKHPRLAKQILKVLMDDEKVTNFSEYDEEEENDYTANFNGEEDDDIPW